MADCDVLFSVTLERAFVHHNLDDGRENSSAPLEALLLGDHERLGAWDTSRAVPMHVVSSDQGT